MPLPLQNDANEQIAGRWIDKFERGRLRILAELKEQLEIRNKELLTVKLELIDNKITTLQKDYCDMEDRLRVVETSRVRFETLAWLAFGGGAVSILNIILAALTKV